MTTSTSGIRDNHGRGTVGDFLQKSIATNDRLSVVSAYFTIYAYQELRAQLDNIHSMRFLFGEPRFLQRLDPEKTDKKAFDIEESGLNLSNRLQQRATARACADWMRDKVEIRSIIKPGFLHGKLYHINDGEKDKAILGSSNFTVAGLGLSQRPNLELNLEVDNRHDRHDLYNWFGELWCDEKLTEDVKDQVLTYLKQLYVNHSPEFIYYKTLYHLFEEFWNGQGQRNPFDAAEHLYDTAIWGSLFEFQKHGVSGLVNRIQKHGGAILADAVGLGKTYEALGVIKYFENLNARVLVLCPKKLRENWTVYQAHNGSQLNPFIRDRFGYTVLSHTDLSRDGGKSGDVNLGNFNWAAFDLVVIDESHNFRNNTRGKRDENGDVVTRSRYERLMEDIIKAGGKTKVLLLSATPVNNDLKDLRNQMYLLTGDQDGAYATSMGVVSLKDTLAAAQRTFSEWAKPEGPRAVAALMEKLPSAFFKLMDEITIARSRRHIVRHYADSLAEIGAFPTRKPVISEYPRIDTEREFLSYDDLNDQISEYKLALFSPFRFVKAEFRPIYEEKQVANFSQENRENFLVGMMKVNFLKRLESSVYAFTITLRRTLDKIENLEMRIAEFEKEKRALAKQKKLDLAQGIPTGEGEEDVAEAFQIGAKNYDLSHIRIKDWKNELKEDWAKLHAVWEAAEKITPERDQKLCELKAIIADKIENPPLDLNDKPNPKTLVFTAFSDTASYLYENLSVWLKEKYNAESALVCGGGATKATWGPTDFGSILVNFSPQSKSRDRLDKWDSSREITVLFATDCISEGQNLQDCDLVVNYDIHWNPVRLIQRFGRIDRIGSHSRAVQMINFWPTPDLNRYINLKNRVEARMALVDVAATTEDNLLSSGEENADEKPLEELIQSDLRYRDKQLLRLKEEVLDLEEMQEGGVSLDAFSLDDFRQDLLNYLDTNRRELAEAPLGLYSLVEPHPHYPQLSPGVLWCLKRRDQSDDASAATTPIREAARVNPMEPYFLVYIRDNGEVRYGFPQAKQVLDSWRALSLGQPVHEQLCQLFDEETNDGAQMETYDALLKGAVKAVSAAFQKRNQNQISLQAGRGGQLVSAAHAVSQTTDYDLVSWCIIKRPTV